MGKLSELFDRISGGKQEEKFIEPGVKYDEVPIRIIRSGESVTLQQYDATKTTVIPPGNVWMYGGDNSYNFFHLSLDDYWDEEAMHFVTGVTTNNEYYVKSGSWVPPESALLPDRLVESGPAPEAIIKEKYYMRRGGDSVRFIRYEGQVFTAKLRDVNSGGIEIIDGKWYCVELTRQWAGADITLVKMSESVPTMSDVIGGRTNMGYF